MGRFRSRTVRALGLGFWNVLGRGCGCRCGCGCGGGVGELEFWEVWEGRRKGEEEMGNGKRGKAELMFEVWVEEFGICLGLVGLA